jgi:hypothetical protein
MIKRLKNDEGGWVLVTAAVLMAVMLSIGLVALKLVDNDSHRTREQREMESSLNLDEGALYAQSLILGQYWPTAASHQYAVPYCDSTSATQPPGCPSPANLAGTGAAANFKNVDQLAKTRWKTKVRDNDGALATSYDPTKADLAQTGPKGTCPGPCNYDFNGDNEVWLQAQTYVHGHPRNVVARMRLEKLSENVPKVAVTSGALAVTNNGNHGGTPIIDAGESAVNVRCNTSDNGCIQGDSDQISPWPPQPSNPPSMMTPAQLARMKQRAISDGHYFSGCPGDGPTAYEKGYDLSGPVVWVEGCASPPNLTNKVPTTSCTPPNGMSTNCINSETSPGILIWHCGRADFAGSFTFRGVLYVVNNSDGTCPATLPQRGDYKCTKQPSVSDTEDVLNANGGFGVWGAVAVDGPACLKVGSNNLQIKFDGRVFDAVQSYGTVGLVQNTWRELQPNAF